MFHLLPVLLTGALASAPPDAREVPLVVRLGIDLVQVDAVVTDKKGRAVTDLGAADFEVRQDGRVQAVTQAFYMGSVAGVGAPPRPALQGPAEPEAALPEVAAESPEAPSDAIVFVVDDLSMSLSGVDATRRALLAFADAMEDGAQVFLLRTAGRAVDIQPLAGAGELRAAARALRYQVLPGSNPDPTRAGLPPFHLYAEATSLYLNGLLARQSLLSLKDITDALRSWKGRKTLVLFSEGFPLWDPTVRERFAPLDLAYGRGEDLLDAVERLTDLANRASVVMHTVDPRGLVTIGISAQDPMTMPHATAVNTLQARRNALHTSQGSLVRLAEGTGGLAVVNSNDLGSGVARIVSDSRSYYLIGYEPAPETFASERPRFHRLEVKVKRPGLKVRSRRGFFGLSDAALAALAPPPTY
ncbi:MAG TPA: VWA domain-containing protein [Vicinamibacteria bacterium]